MRNRTGIPKCLLRELPPSGECRKPSARVQRGQRTAHSGNDDDYNENKRLRIDVDVAVYKKQPHNSIDEIVSLMENPSQKRIIYFAKNSFFAPIAYLFHAE